MFRRLALFTILMSSLSMGATVFIATDQTGQQTQIDVNHTSTWLLSVNTPIDFGGGVFSMKDGQTASADVVLTLYEGADNTGTILRQVTLSHTAFCTGFANCGSFDYHPFVFSTPYAMTTGTNYYLALTSSAPDTQSDAYFIKNNGRFAASDTVPTPLTPSPFVGVTAVPEPSTMLLSGIGLVALGVLGRRTRR